MVIFFILLIAFIIFILYGIYQLIEQSVKAKENAEKWQIEQIQLKQKIEKEKEEEKKKREEYTAHYQNSKKVNSFAKKIANEMSDVINREFRARARTGREKTYQLEFRIKIDSDRIYYMNYRGILLTRLEWVTFISFANENLNPLQDYLQRCVLASVLGEKVFQRIEELVPNGPFGEKGSFRFEVNETVKERYYNGPVAFIYLDYTDEEYQKSYSDL